MQGTHQDMHREHRRWAADAALWQEEVALWRQQCAQALADATRLEGALRKHAQQVVEHEAAIRVHVERVRKHEHALADFEKAGTEENLLLLAKKHRSEAEQHARQLELHERMKHQHHALMAEWTRIVTELAK